MNFSPSRWQASLTGFSPWGNSLGLQNQLPTPLGKLPGNQAASSQRKSQPALAATWAAWQLPGLGGPRGMAVVAIVALPEDGHGQRPRLLLGRVVEEHQAAETVVRRQPVALPGHEQDSRAADRLAGVQPQMGLLHAGAKPGRPGRVAFVGRGPLAGPADGGEQPASLIVEIEERETCRWTTGRRWAPGGSCRRREAGSPAAGTTARCSRRRPGGAARPAARARRSPSATSRA